VVSTTAQLKALQADRKKAAAEAMEQAKLLYQYAEAQGKPYEPEAFFTTAPEVKESVFSSTEVVREMSRARLLNNAKIYDIRGTLRKKDQSEQPVEAAAGSSTHLRESGLK